MSKDATLRVIRTLAAIVIIAALGVQAWADLTFGTFTWDELPGYFTPIAASAAIVALLAGAATVNSRPRWVDLLRVNAATYTAVTGIVYWAVLADAVVPKVPWANFVLHGGAGIIMALDWLVVRLRHRVPLRMWWSVLALPGVWLGYLLVRANLDGWVPYPFLDPSGGLAPVLMSIAIIVTCGMVVAAILHGVAMLHARWRTVPAMTEELFTGVARR